MNAECPSSRATPPGGEPPFAPVAAKMFSGALIWAAHFGAIYACNGIACARGFDALRWLGTGIVVWIVSGATLVAIAAAAGILIPILRKAGTISFADTLAAGGLGFALLGIVLEWLTVFIVPACG